MRCASLIVQKISQYCCSSDQESVDIIAGHVANLGYVAQSLALKNLDNNSVVAGYFSDIGGMSTKSAESGEV